MRTHGTTAALLALAVGCSNVNVIPVKPSNPKPESCTLDIYTSESEVKRSFEVACLIHSRTGHAILLRDAVEDAIENAKADACKCGADAILIVSVDEEVPTTTSYGVGKATIRALRYTD